MNKVNQVDQANHESQQGEYVMYPNQNGMNEMHEILAMSGLATASAVSVATAARFMRSAVCHRCGQVGNITEKNLIMTRTLTLLTALAAFAMAGSASAGTLLFLDNYNTAALGAAFNNAGPLASDQSGTAATNNYNINWGNGWEGGFQRGNGGTWLMYAGTAGFGSTNMAGSLNYDFAAEANTLSSALEISFNMSVTNGVTLDAWTSFMIGTAQNQFVNDASVGFSSLFRDNGGTQQFSNGGAIGSTATFADGNLITFLVSDASGTGSAFNDNGANDTVAMYVNGTLTDTFTGLNLTADDQYISFNANNTVANIDNLSIFAVPEPSTALLAGLGGLGLLGLYYCKRAK